jgi:hypothetical protein
MQVLNKYDKENLVIKLHQEGKTMREIASAAQFIEAINHILS